MDHYRIRAEIGMRQEALALEAHLDRSYTGGVERGERNVAYENLVRIADALGVQSSALLARAERHGASIDTLPAKQLQPSRRMREE